MRGSTTRSGREADASRPACGVDPFNSAMARTRSSSPPSPKLARPGRVGVTGRRRPRDLSLKAVKVGGMTCLRSCQERPDIAYQ